MPQGTVKAKVSKPKAKTLHSAKQKSKSTTNKVAKSKDYKKAQAREMARKGAAGLTGNLEKMLAERAGYTEMVKADQSKKRGTGLVGNTVKSSKGMGSGKKGSSRK